MAGSVPAASLSRAFSQGEAPQIPAGPFLGTRASLAAYRAPDWFRDAKFGI